MGALCEGRGMRQFILHPKKTPEGHNREQVIDRLVETVEKLPSNQRWSITIKRHVQSLSDLQRRYYRGVVVPALCAWSGATADEMHEALLWHLAEKQTISDCTKLDGASVTVPVRTSQMNRNQMGDYIDRCIAFAAENGVLVPAPDRWAA